MFLVEREWDGPGDAIAWMRCHPKLPLLAGWTAESATVHVWDSDTGRQLATVVGAGNACDAAWHHDQPLLAVADETGVRQWTAAGVLPLAASPSRPYAVWFTPDGRRLWVTPTDDEWESSDVVDGHAGTVTRQPPWDTGVALHPSGGLVATLVSNQGATLFVFARVDDAGVMRARDRALIFEADCYMTPIWNPDGRYLAIRGNAYEHLLAIVEFPTLRQVLVTRLGAHELESERPWSFDNVAFAPAGQLLVGTPDGSIVTIDSAQPGAVEHDVADAPISALAVTAAGDCLIATRDGRLVRLSMHHDDVIADNGADRVAAFLERTVEVAQDADLEALDGALRLTDGVTDWSPDELETVTEAHPTDPAWLQIQAHMNRDR